MRAVADAQTPDGTSMYDSKQRGWGGIKNGELLKRAEDEFDLFVTSDQNIRYQQNPRGPAHSDS